MALAVLIAAACASAPPSAPSATPVTLEELVPLVHPLDPEAPIAYRQWPLRSRPGGDVADTTPMHGATMLVWRDRAILTLDETPLTQQFDALPSGLTAAQAAQQLRVKRWELTAQTCPAITGLYDLAMSSSFTPAAHTWSELHVIDRSGRRIDTTGDHSWVARAWLELYHACVQKKPA